MNLKEFSLILLEILILLPILAIFASAQLGSNFPQFPFQTLYSPEALAAFLGVPAQWLVVPQVIYYVIVPFIVAVTVTYGILTELNIFRNSRAAGKVNIILSVAMAFLLLPSGILTTIVSYFYAANVFIGLVGFGVLFLFGTIMWVYGRGRSMRYEFGYKADIAKNLQEKIKELDRKEEILKKQRAAAIGRGANQNILAKINNDLIHVHTERDEYLKRVKDIVNS